MFSFSQNFEDVYLHRAFHDVAAGFYIDAGAFDPVLDSVTKHFYDRGWHGINIEPGPRIELFADRTRDINLPVALGPTDGDATFFYDPRNPGMSTATADRGAERTEHSAETTHWTVPMRSLEGIWREFCADRHVHLVKLDIEGGEWDVLRLTDWRRYRPEIIVAECTRPATNDRLDQGWAAHMATAGFEEVFFDGINVYYLAEESAARRPAFNRPVNVLDGFDKYRPPS